MTTSEMREEQEFDLHDNRIYSIFFDQTKEESQVVLEIDHILEWSIENEANFLISPAQLVFYDATDLMTHIEWGYTGFSTALLDLRIQSIMKRDVESPVKRPNYYYWDIALSGDRSFIRLGASSCNVIILEEARWSRSQQLDRRSLCLAPSGSSQR